MNSEWSALTGSHPGVVRTICLPAALNSIRKIVHLLQMTAEETQRRAGVGAGQLFVLLQLEHNGSCSIHGLAERTMTDTGAITAVVDRLVNARLARREESAKSGQVEIVITSAGRNVLQNAPEAPTARLLSGLARLADNELYALAVGLARLQQELGLEDERLIMLFENDSDPS